VLDMGEPIKVVDLAADLIRLSGLEVHVDVEIAFTGLRPGEKLYEELFVSPESIVPTAHSKIMRARDDDFALEALTRIPQLIEAARNGTHPTGLRRMISQIVPEYLGKVETGEFAVANDASTLAAPMIAIR
jgi:FlaA1/EpsC-like NDP-sugar epimerase